ncbi:MAG: fatty acid desaturase [Xanthomonadales bacterium]|nr:fatty acid desaturase [Xanthomonadales bacterium]
MKSITAFFHEPLGLAYHGGALLYALAAYSFGIWGLLQPSLWLNALAVLVWGHGMTIAAYLIHEAAHNTVFRNNAHNARFGALLGWLTGSCYGTFEDIRYKHFRHHMDNDDSVWFLYEELFARRPGLLKLIKVLEWAWIPAHELLMHGLLMISAFVIPERREQRLRQTLIVALRGALFLSVLWLWPKVAVGYLLAYMVMLHVLRFMDAIQHDYGANPTLFDKQAPSRFGGRKTEQLHTFSNPISFRYDLPNWLVLNFGFHNAHHKRPTVPWYRLPAYYREQISADPASVIPLRQQLRMYARHRVYRVDHRGGPFDDLQDLQQHAYLEAGRRGQLYGGNAVSFLTPF